jgi:hypothetical protein
VREVAIGVRAVRLEHDAVLADQVDIGEAGIVGDEATRDSPAGAGDSSSIFSVQ